MTIQTFGVENTGIGFISHLKDNSTGSVFEKFDSLLPEFTNSSSVPVPVAYWNNWLCGVSSNIECLAYDRDTDGGENPEGAGSDQLVGVLKEKIKNYMAS